MLLRASGEISGDPVDANAVTDAAVAPESGVAHGEALVRFADALVARDGQALARSREELREVLGPAGLVDAAGVASNFERMVRIADGTGIPLDAPLQILSEGLRAELGLDEFRSSANTRSAGVSGRVAARALTPVATLALRAIGAWQRRRSR